MIYDPENVNLAIDHHGTVLMRVTKEENDATEQEKWSPLHDFRRPEW